MLYFVTGASGFIGKRFVRKILERPDAQAVVLLRDASPEALARLREFCGDTGKRIVAVQGDITAEKLGVATKDARKLKGKIDHVVHLAAIYDLTADPIESDNRWADPDLFELRQHLRTELKHARTNSVPERNNPWPYASRRTPAKKRGLFRR